MKRWMSGTLSLWTALSLVGSGLLACCSGGKSALTPSISFTFPSDGQVLNPSAGAAAGTVNLTVTLSTQNVSTGSPVTLTIDGASGGPTATVGSGGAVSIPSVVLNGTPAGSAHTLQASVTDSGGNGTAQATVHVTVVVPASTCTVTISPPTGTIFNETGAVVNGKTTVKDENTTPNPAGVAATITATTTCTGTATLSADGTQIATTTVSGGQAIFQKVLLPNTPVTSLQAVPPGEAFTVSVGTNGNGGDATVNYIVDSTIPTCTITTPAAGKTYTEEGNVDPNLPGIQIDVTGTTSLAPQIAAGIPANVSIVNGSGTTYAAPNPSVDGAVQANGSYEIEITLVNGSDPLVCSVTSATGNVGQSSATTVTANGTPVLSIIEPTSGEILNASDNQSSTGQGFATQIVLSTSAANGSTITVCSTVAPSSGAGACPFSSSDGFEVGTVSAAGGSTTFSNAPLGNGPQTLNAQVKDSSSNLTANAAPVSIQVQASRPVVMLFTFSSDYVDSDGGLWLNSADLNDAGVAATMATVLLDAGDTFYSPDAGPDGGPVQGSLSIVALQGSGSSTVGGPVPVGFDDAGDPQAVVPLTLPDGPYQLEVRVSDVWGNSDYEPLLTPPLTSPQAETTLNVKTSLPSCSFTSPTGSYWNVADNGGVAASGNVSVPVTLATANATASTVSGSTIPGSLSIGPSGGSQTEESVPGASTNASVSLPQGPDDILATLSDPAGNPSATCSLPITVATEPPTLTIGACTSASNCDWTPLPDSFQGTTPVYTSTRDVQIPVTTSGVEVTYVVNDILNGTAIPPYGGGSLPVSGGEATIPENFLNGTNTIMVTATDAAGNATTVSIQELEDAAGCGLAFTTPSQNPAYFNATSGTVSGNPAVLQTAIVLQSDCPLTQVTLTKTPSGGSPGQSSQTTNGSGVATFPAVDFDDGETGTLEATITGGTAPAGPITYYTKLTPPQIVAGSAVPSSSNVWVVASAGNPNAGSTVSGTAYVASLSAYDASSNPFANGSFSVQVTNLGPGTTYGTAALTLSFGGNPPAQILTSASQTVTFAPVDLPPEATTSGTVTLTVTDGAGNSVSQSWSVKTSAISPGAPASETATVTDERHATVQLGWNAPADGAGNAVAGYDLRWTPFAPAGSSPWGSAMTDSTFFGAGANPDPTGGINSLAGTTPGSGQSYNLTGLPPFNSWSIALRSVDAAGNRSEPISVVSANDNTISGNPAQAWNQVTYQEPGGNFFGGQMVMADFNGDGLQDLAISDSQQNSTPGSVWVIPGSASPTSIANVTQASGVTTLSPGSDGDYFGYGMAATGDLVGSGNAGLAVGSPGWQSYQGRVDIYAGSASGLSTTPILELQGAGGAAGWFGASVETIGDLDGDGISDFFVGAPFDSSGQTSAQGNGYVYLSTSLKKAIASSGSGTTIVPLSAADLVFEGMPSPAGNFGLGFAAMTLGNGFFALPAAGASSVYGFNATTVLADEASQHGGTAVPIAASSAAFSLTDGNANPVVDGVWESYGTAGLGGVTFTGKEQDFIVGDAVTSSVYVYATTSNGASSTPFATLNTGGSYMGWAVAAEDVNEDGNLDILVGTNASNNYGAFLFLNQGASPYFSASPSASLLNGTDQFFGFGVAVGRFTDTTHPDIAVSDGTSIAILYY